MTTLKRQFQVLAEDDDGTLLKVAFATSNGTSVDQHFGSAESFAIYGVNIDTARLLGVSEFGQLVQDGNEDKLAAKLDLLDGTIAVYCRACGASAVRQLLARNVQPVKVNDEDVSINDLIAGLQAELRAGPSAWLAKAIERQQPVDASKFDEMLSEGWSE